MKRTDITSLFPEATDEQINQLLHINGTDISNTKNGLSSIQSQLDTANEEIRRLKDGPTAEKLQAEIDKANQLQKELDNFKHTDALRQMREKVAGEKGVPINLLNGDTEEACAKQADEILSFAQGGSYPSVKDGGEPNNPSNKPNTGKQFAEWAKEFI